MQPWIHFAKIDMRQMSQCCTAACNLFAVDIRERDAERLRHACATVVGGAAANTDDKVTTTEIESGENQFAHAVGRRDARVAQRGWHKWQSCCCRHLNSCCLPVAEYAKKGIHGIVERPCDNLLDDAPARRVNQCLHSAFSAVGHRYNHRLSLWINCFYATSDGSTGLCGGQTPFERLWGDDNTHGDCSLVCLLRYPCIDACLRNIITNMECGYLHHWFFCPILSMTKNNNAWTVFRHLWSVLCQCHLAYQMSGPGVRVR